ncbi:proton extrusion protein PcxA [Leptolyngbya sp. FACHB-17]|uniref:proton extrusion protein PcxA n=1 Tax=unclassified Leptolyngbya TaxID=2650499 RepID=UPI00167FFE80|nr:proton extrusion protein PcxA [Leptolyngbya sp. FACHB-17]MBD2082284.1 proton extrusion protein PcxA [Leptolyngbya sp. FACHB-17]
MNNNSLLSQFRAYVRRAERWYLETPDRALDQAYDAALKIKAIENEHFSGKKIAPHSTQLRGSAFEYFSADLQKYLRMMRMRLTEFRRSRAALAITNPNKTTQEVRTIETTEVGSSRFVPTLRDKSSITLEKLRFIDEILARYADEQLTLEAVSTAMLSVERNGGLAKKNSDQDLTVPEAQKVPTNDVQTSEDFESISDKTGLLPRSILATLKRLRRDLDPKSEDEVVQNYRISKVKTLLAVRFVLVLILVPLLVQQVTRNFVLSERLPVGAWISQQFTIENPDRIFINGEMAEEALREMQGFEERLKFENIIKETLERNILSSEEVEARAKLRSQQVEVQVREKATEIAEQFSSQSANVIRNWIADILATIAFTFVLLNGKREIEILKSFMDETVYGLSDSAKAFIIILFTDVFVGFHSPHGWEIILEGISRHFGLPTSRDFIFLFIATFPVILDTIFKYWIFRYLNRVSPSAVATYREMNE